MDPHLFRQLFLQAMEREVHLLHSAMAVWQGLASKDFPACCAIAFDLQDANACYLERLRPVARKMGVDLDDGLPRIKVSHCAMP